MSMFMFDEEDIMDHYESQKSHMIIELELKEII